MSVYGAPLRVAKASGEAASTFQVSKLPEHVETQKIEYEPCFSEIMIVRATKYISALLYVNITVLVFSQAGARDAALWESTCLACTGLEVPSPAWREEKTNQEHGCVGFCFVFWFRGFSSLPPRGAVLPLKEV